MCSDAEDHILKEYVADAKRLAETGELDADILVPLEDCETIEQVDALLEQYS